MSYNELLRQHRSIRHLQNKQDEYAVLCIISVSYKNEECNPHYLEQLDYNKIPIGKFKHKNNQIQLKKI